MEVDPIEDTPTVDATRRPVDKRRRSIDDATETDVALALDEPKSKRFCLRVETASQVHRRGIKRKCSTTAEVDDAVEQKPKRARICADAPQDQSKVAEVSRFIDCSFIISYFTVVSIFFIPI